MQFFPKVKLYIPADCDPNMQYFQGIARKVALATVTLTAIGWLLVLIGFSYGTTQEPVSATGSITFPFWAVIIGGPVAIICAIVQAALPRPMGTIVGGISTFFACLFISSLGMILYGDGIDIRNGFTELKFTTLTFAGSLIAILFWTGTLILANFYDFKGMDQSEFGYDRRSFTST